MADRRIGPDRASRSRSRQSRDSHPYQNPSGDQSNTNPRSRGGRRGGRGGRGRGGYQAGEGSSRGSASYDSGNNDLAFGSPQGVQRCGASDQNQGNSFFGQNRGVPQPNGSVHENEDKALSRYNQNDLSRDAKIPYRPAYGRRGTRCVVWANYFELKVNDRTLYKYVFEIESIPRSDGSSAPKRQSGGKLQFLASRLMEVLRSMPEAQGIHMVTEYKSQIITTAPLPLPASNTVELSVSSSLYTDVYNAKFYPQQLIETAKVREYLDGDIPTVDPHGALAPLYPEVTDALGVVMGFHAKSTNLDSLLTKSKYFPQESQERLVLRPKFSDAVRGYFQSVRMGTNRFLLNVNVCTSVLRRSINLSEIFDFYGINVSNPSSVMGQSELEALDLHLRKSRVFFKEPNNDSLKRPRTINCIVGRRTLEKACEEVNGPKFANEWVGPNHAQFYLKEDQAYRTVTEHYVRTYGFTPNPKYPLVNIGSNQNAVLIPAELIQIMAQPVKYNLNSAEKSAMINFACRSPLENAESIQSASRHHLGLDNREILDPFGVTVPKGLLTVTGRVLDAPQLKYGLKDIIRTSKGQWNNAKKKYYQGARVDKLAWVNTSHNRSPLISRGVEEFNKFLRRSGINIQQERIDEIPYASTTGLEAAFKQAQQRKYKLLIVVVDGNDETYRRIKYLGDVKYGISTVCGLGRQFESAKLSYFNNVGLKVNIKLGGVNHILDREQIPESYKSTMIIGYDVTHPTDSPSSSSSSKSFAAFVASTDAEFTNFPGVFWAQTGKKEMLDEDNLQKAMTSRLYLYRKYNNGQLPQNIIIFRDGVSEGQFAQVLDNEYPNIVQACKKAYGANNFPKFTILVSVKRHHTRFFPASSSQTDSGNVQAGTVVDRGVTQSRFWDYFLTSHNSIKGTARPAHYTVLMDEIFRNMKNVNPADALQSLTNNLCYLYARATRAVGLCPPAYYADILCERAKLLHQASGGKEVVVHENIRDTMFYM